MCRIGGVAMRQLTASLMGSERSQRDQLGRAEDFQAGSVGGIGKIVRIQTCKVLLQLGGTSLVFLRPGQRQESGIVRRRSARFSVIAGQRAIVCELVCT